MTEKSVDQWVSEIESQVSGVSMAASREVELALNGTLEELVTRDEILFFSILDNGGEEIAKELQTLGKPEQELELER